MRFSLSLPRTSLALSLLTLPALAGCPMDDDPVPAAPAPSPSGSTPVTPAPTTTATPDAAPAPEPKATHGGLVSIQDITIVNLPAAGHGLTVSAFFTPLVTPD